MEDSSVEMSSRSSEQSETVPEKPKTVPKSVPKKRKPTKEPKPISEQITPPAPKKERFVKLYKPPKEIAIGASIAGRDKAKVRIDRVFVLGFLAGAYIAFGGLFALIIGGGMPGVAATNPGVQKLVFGGTFSFGLMMVVIAGADLFTGNIMYETMAFLDRKITILDLLKNWGIVYMGNFVGSVFFAFFLGYLTEFLDNDPWLSFVQNLAEMKVNHYGWGVLLLRGVGCNWLVTMAVYLAVCAEDVVAKMAAVFFPLTAFVSMGFEHSVANMFFIPVGMMYGADVSFWDFLWKNLLPVTIGNIIGGSFLLAAPYWYIYLLPSKKNQNDSRDNGKEEPKHLNCFSV